jgi:tetratricopeptide (TPR) repeat protein
MASSARIEELRKKFEENPRRYFAPLANEYRKAGDIEQAISICREYLPQQPGHMSGHIVYGQALYEARQFEEAKSVFETALSLDPENLIALRHLGDIALILADSDGARAWYRRVLEADPRNEEIQAQLATLDQMSQGGEATPVSPGAVPAGGSAGSPTPSSAPTVVVQAKPQLVKKQPWATPKIVTAISPTLEVPVSTPTPQSVPVVQPPSLSTETTVEIPKLSEPPAMAGSVDDHASPAAAEAPATTVGSVDGLESGSFEPPPAVQPLAELEPSSFEPPAAVPQLAELEPAAFQAPSSVTPLPELEHGGGPPSTSEQPPIDTFSLDGLETTSMAPPSPETSTPVELPTPVESPRVEPPTDRSEDAVAEPAEGELDFGLPTEARETVAAEPPRAAETAPEPPAPDPALPRLSMVAMEAISAPEFDTPTPSSESSSTVAVSADQSPWAPSEIVAAASETAAATSEAGAVTAETAESSEATEPPAETSKTAEASAPLSSPEAASSPMSDLPMLDVGPSEGSRVAAEAKARESEASEPSPTTAPSDHTADFGDGVAESTPQAPDTGPFVTETMAELYLQQGHRDEALRVYRALAEQQPENASLRERIANLTMAVAPEIQGPTIQELLAAIARRRPGTGTSAPSAAEMSAAPPSQSNGLPSGSDVATSPPTSPTPAAPLAMLADAIASTFGFAAVRPADESAASTLALAFASNGVATGSTPDVPGSPARPAAGELSLDAVFGTGQPAAPPASTFSFDQFFSARVSTQQVSGGDSGSGGKESGEEVKQFTRWLEGLKGR